MLDIQFIRDNPELVKEKSKQKGYDIDINELLELDTRRRKMVTEAEKFRAEETNCPLTKMENHPRSR